jgi:hypothetical protein
MFHAPRPEFEQNFEMVLSVESAWMELKSSAKES